MPSHIYVLLGMYHDAAEANLEAIEKDDLFVAKEGIFNFYTGYRLHNMHFVAYAAMFAGKEHLHHFDFIYRSFCD